MRSFTYALISLAIILISIFFNSTKMPTYSAIRASNAAFSPAYKPVAIFVGGTSGIGQGIAEAFARHVKGNAHLVIIGRNRAAAEAIISKFPKPTTAGITHEFVQCDVTKMKNIQSVTKELLTRLPKINFLVMTPGIMTTKGREETDEGIDKKLAVHYYARWKFTNDLLPALLRANADGEDAKVFSVLAAGKGGEIDLDDLGLKKHYSLSNAALAAPTYNDLAMEVCDPPLSRSISLLTNFSGIFRKKSRRKLRARLPRRCPHVDPVILRFSLPQGCFLHCSRSDLSFLDICRRNRRVPVTRAPK